MTAPLFFVDAGALAGMAPGSVVVLDGPEGRHAATVRRIGPGEQVQVADGTGSLATGEVTDSGGGRLVIRLGQIGQVQASVPRFVLVQALAKGGRDEQAIEAATELGVDAVVPWQADRSIVQWRGDKQRKGSAKWEAVVRAAAKQSRRAIVPTVEPLVTSKSLPERLAGASALVLHEDADLPIGEIPADGPFAGDELVVVVGPEGGISQSELDAFSAAGARIARLGPHVLRSSTAGPAAIAALSARIRW